MKALRLHAHDGPGGLVYEDAPEPRATAGEVLVAVHAAGVIPTELGWGPTRTARDGTPRQLPLVPGHEFSGVVAACGPGVAEFRVGDAVYGTTDWYADGALAEYCVARAADLAVKPRSIDHVHAAAVPISALTAWEGVLERGGAGPGQRVLVHGGAGGVGTFAVQLAAWRDAHVIATCSATNAALVRELGANETVDYATTRFEDVVRDVDLVFDTVGGDTLARSLPLLRADGRALTVAADARWSADPRVREAFFVVSRDAGDLTEIAQYIDDGTLRSVVAEVIPLAEARRAYERRRGGPAGKTVVAVVLAER
jgi:NADPH:quinone reductase-like Zn-dependent oxidoreductase